MGCKESNQTKQLSNDILSVSRYVVTIGLVSLAYLSNDILAVSGYVVTLGLVSLAYLSNDILSVS